MKAILGLSLLAATVMYADTPAADPAKQLYEAGLRQTQEGKLERARLTLQTLVNAYPRDPLALDAKGAIDATLLYEEGQTRAKSGKLDTARLAFETLIAVYPENPLVPKAKIAIAALAEKEKNRPMVKAMEFRDFSAISAEAIRAALEAREVRLTVGKPYRPRDVEQAKVAVEEILAEHGASNVRVTAQALTVRHDAVDVIFTPEKPHASLLSTPWRLAMAGWHRVRPGSDTPENGL